MKHLLLVFALFTTYRVCGQTITISARVIDRTTQEPLPYASVGIKDKSISTITNLQGEFDFHLPQGYRNEILVISMLGYANFEAPVWSVLSSNQVQTILMDKSPTVLDEVTVSDSLTGGDIFRIAVDRIDKNFPTQPYIAEGFYRDVKKVGGTYISLLEAAVKIYDEDYSEPRNKFRLRERVKLLQVRQSLGYENKFTSFFQQDNLLEDLLLHNSVRYRLLDTHEEVLIKLKRERDSYYNGHQVFVVSDSEEYKMKMYVDKEDFSIIHFEYEIGFQDQVISRKKDLISKFDKMTKSMDFKRYGNTMYLNFMTMTTHVNWYDAQTNKLKFGTELVQQLLINSIDFNTKERITSTEKMRNYGLQYQDLPYNKAFWDSYNVIKDTPLDKQILNDLEKHIPLNRQFEN